MFRSSRFPNSHVSNLNNLQIGIHTAILRFGHKNMRWSLSLRLCVCAPFSLKALRANCRRSAYANLYNENLHTDRSSCYICVCESVWMNVLGSRYVHILWGVLCIRVLYSIVWKVVDIKRWARMHAFLVQVNEIAA